MKQVYLDGIILRVTEELGNDPDIREDFVRKILTSQLKRVVPMSFFPIRSKVSQIRNGSIFIDEEVLSVIGIDRPEKSNIPFLYLYEEKVYEPTIASTGTYVTNSLLEQFDGPIDINDIGVQQLTNIIQDAINNSGMYDTRPLPFESTYIKGIGHVNKLGCYRFSESVLNNEIAVSTDQSHVCVFYYSPYLDRNGRMVVPKFAEEYLVAYGTMRLLEVLLNKGLKGKAPTAVAQTRYTIIETRKKVTNEFLTMQRTINLTLDKLIVKPVNPDGDVSTF
jgi:hypothetical protein